MDKKLYTYVCSDCGKTFRTDDSKNKTCSECLKFRRPHKPHKTKKEILTFAELLHIAEVYCKVNGKYIHYGDVVNLINLNPKKCVCCGAEVYEGKHICQECEKR